MKYTALPGAELLRRRMAGECLECIEGRPLGNPATGFPYDLCERCRAEEIEELLKAKVKAKRDAQRFPTHTT